MPSCGGYKDFDDCVAKNKGKVDDPEAYCAAIKRKTEGEKHEPSLAELLGGTYQAVGLKALLADLCAPDSVYRAATRVLKERS